MKLAIVGSRSFMDYELLISKIKLFTRGINITEIVSGGAKGADSLAERFAKDQNIKTKIFPADWNNFGKSAGMIRNKDIVKYSDIIIAFWDGKSTGTKNSIDLCLKLKKKISIVYF